MHRLPLFLLLLLFLTSGCRKEEDVATVTFWAQCNSCRITYGIEGQVLGSDSIGGAPVVRIDAPAKVGDEVFITGRPLAVSNTGMGVAIRVDGQQQGFTFLRPTTEALLDSTLEVRIRVPRLDRFGRPVDQ